MKGWRESQKEFHLVLEGPFEQQELVALVSRAYYEYRELSKHYPTEYYKEYQQAKSIYDKIMEIFLADSNKGSNKDNPIIRRDSYNDESDGISR
jgi:heme oxygenase